VHAALNILSNPIIKNRVLISSLPAILLLAGAVNGFVVRIIEAWQLSGTSAIFFGISPFELIAIAVAGVLYHEAGEKTETLPGPGEYIFLIALLVPSSTVSWLATFLYAIFHAARSKSNEQNAALLFAALSICSIWSSVIMKSIAVPVTNLEASIVWHAISYLRDDLMLNGNIIGIPDGHRIVLLIACTALYGLPKAALGYAAISLYLGNSKAKSLLAGLSATIIFYAAANLVRLIAMTWSEEAFHIAHGAIGANIFDGLTTAAIFAIAFLVCELKGPSPSPTEHRRHA